MHILLNTLLRRKSWGIAIGIFTLVPWVVSAGEPGRRELQGHVLPVVSQLTPESRLSATTQLYLAIGLPLRNQAGLGELQRELYDPTSTNFHRYLSPPEFTARFGPTVEDYQAVTEFARSKGLAIVQRHDDRMLLDVSGTAAAVEQAFHLTLQTYRHPAESRRFFAPNTEPSVPDTLPVADIEGLSDYARPHPLIHPAPGASQRPGLKANSGSAPDGSGEYFGGDFRAAYIPGTLLTGSNQVVGLVQFDGFYTSDITNYEAEAGLPNVTLQTVLLDGFSGTPTTGSSSGNPEVSLDIEMVISMAPGISKLLVYEGNPNNFIPNDVLSQIASDDLAGQVSSSWSWSGGPSTTTDSYLAKMITQGQTYFTASGDSDAYTGANSPDSSSAYTTPITSTNVIAVGGTTLSTAGALGAWTGETVWNWNLSGHPNVGSSGGISTNYNIPYWQTNTTTNGNNRSMTRRNLPDVALAADNIYVRYGDGSAGDFGGTSCAAPLWAGFTALVNQQAVAGLKSKVGFLPPALYTLASGTNYNSLFHDITSGNNIGTNTPGLFYAVTGYDLCTGLGTPNGTNLVNALAPFPACLGQPVSQAVTNGANVTFSVAAAGAPALYFQWLCNGTNLVNGGNVTGSAGNVLSLAAVTAGNAGNYSLVLSNSYGSLTSSIAVLSVGIPPAFTLQPTNLTVFGGSNAVFAATVTGSATLAYQWRDNGTNLSNGTGISGVNSNVLTLAAVTINSAGNYSLFVTNPFGTAASSVATLSVIVPPAITNASWVLLAESASPTNGAIDPGETVAVGFTLKNQGTVATSNLVATLLASTNILAPSSSQSYGAVPGYGGTASQPFTFTAAGACGSTFPAVLQLQDGTNNLGTVTFTLSLGKPSGFAQNFDSVTAPALPSGWTEVTVTNAANNWVTTTAAYDTSPNSVFDSDSATSGENALVSQVIAIVSTNAQLGFRHNYSLEYSSSHRSTTYFDGGVLEISVAGGAFSDILSAGGIFSTGGYTASITTSSDNPLGGRSGWVGSSSGWKSVTVKLPSSAAGKNIQLRWNCATDTGNAGSGAVGWYVDSISITDTVFNCETVLTDLAITESLAASSFPAGSNLVYTLAVTNAGPQPAANVVVNDTIPTNAAFVSAPGGSYGGGQVVFTSAMLPVNSVTNFTLTVAPVSGLVFTNVATVATVTPELSPTTNIVTLVSSQIVMLPVSITNPPGSQTIQCGSNAGFNVGAGGTLPLAYQWSLDGTALSGANGASLLLTNVHLPSHTVTVVITNLYGSATSSVPLTVQDTLPPVIMLNGTNPIYIQLGAAYVESGGTAYDVCAGVVPVSISGMVNTGSVSTNTVTYTATDGNGNTNVATRTVIVQDTTPPTILWSFTNLLLAANSNCVAVMPDVTGTNFIQATDLSGVASTTQSPTNGSLLPLGTNWVVMAVADPYGNTAESTNAIVVQDQTPPEILVQPQSLTNAAGTSASFSLAAMACTPLAYLWWSNSVALATQTNSALILSNLDLSAAGNYAVLVSSAGGSITSAVATLTVYLPGINAVSVNPGGSVALNLQGVPGSSYILQGATNLTWPIFWLDLATNTLNTNGVWQFTDWEATNFTQQFYRLLLAP